MTVVEFRKKKKPKNKIALGICALIILLFFFLIGKYISGLKYRTTTAEPFLFLERIEGTGLVIRSEKVYSSTSSGSIKYLVNEGEKVPVGHGIVSISSSRDEILAQIENLEKQIDDLNINHYSSEGNINILEDIQEKVVHGDYNGIYEYLDERISNEEDKTLIAENLESLLKKQDELEQVLEASSIINYSANAGIISYEIDGLEDILKPKGFENYTYEYLDSENINMEEKEFNPTKKVVGGSPIFKIIDDFVWHLAIKVDDGRILEFEEGQVYRVELTDKHSLKGKIVKINRDNAKGVIVIEFKDGLHEFYNERFMKVSIIKSQTNTYKLPTDCIIQKDGQDGVFINHIYGLVKFVPVNIIHEEDDIAYVGQGNNNGNITLNGEEVKTINKFDEIFLYPSNLEEYQIIR